MSGTNDTNSIGSDHHDQNVPDDLEKVHCSFASEKSEVKVPDSLVSKKSENKFFERFELEKAEETGLEKSEEKGLEIVFSPPLYLQRYEKAISLLCEDRWVHAMNRVVSSSGSFAAIETSGV